MIRTIPASSCFRCQKDGIVSGDQARQTASGDLAVGDTTTFYCGGCLNTWHVPRLEALLHGRFLDSAGLR